MRIQTFVSSDLDDTAAVWSWDVSVVGVGMAGAMYVVGGGSSVPVVGS